MATACIKQIADEMPFLASWCPSSPVGSGEEGKMAPAGLFSIGSPHRLWLAFGLASGIECWCHTMALPQSLSHLWFFSFWAEVQLAGLQTWCQW